MLRRVAFVAVIAFMAIHAIGQNKHVQFEELKALQANEAKPVVVLIMTDWCKYCHAMKNTMLTNKKVSLLLGDKFRTIFLNAEEKKDITFAGRTFKYNRGINELAKELGTIKGQVSYPSLCVLNSKNEIIYQHDGYLSAQAMLYTLKKISEN